MSSPSRLNTGCGLTCITIIKSPGGPPRTPTEPSPAFRMCNPEYAPSGTLIGTVFVDLTLPVPLQCLHLVSNILPSPLSLIHISEPTRLGMISYAVFCLKKKKQLNATHCTNRQT